MSTYRKPLSAKNSDYEVVKKKPRKREGAPFRILGKSSIIEHLNLIMKEVLDSSPSLKLTEEDLQRPTPEMAQAIYYKLLCFSFDIQPLSLTQAPFTRSGSVLNPELTNEFVTTIQFFRAMKFLMSTCLTDFRLTDLTAPDSKRLCKHLSALINFVKFHQNVFEADEAMCVIKERKHKAEDDFTALEGERENLSRQVHELERKRKEEHELEEEHKATMVAQTQQMQSLQQHNDMLTQEHHQECELNERSGKRLAELMRELDRVSQKVEDLRCKVVTSPDKLRASRSRLQEEVGEAVATVKDLESQQRMWEALSSRAQQVPEGVIRLLNENVEVLIEKAKMRNDLSIQYYGKMEENSRQEQLLQDATSKFQSLRLHLRTVEEDSGRVDLQEASRSPHSRVIEELQRELELRQEEIRAMDQQDEMNTHKIEEMEAQMMEYRQMVEISSAELEDMVKALLSSANRKRDEYNDILKKLGFAVSS